MRIMKTDDIFLLPRDANDAVCITTNGIIRADGRAVMGRGIARIADIKFDLAWELAQRLRKTGNHVYYLGPRRDRQTGRSMTLFTFPTKHDWRQDSDPELIRQSALELVELVRMFHIETCYLTKPGCANGHLDWETQVRPILEPILDDRFVIADRDF